MAPKVKRCLSYFVLVSLILCFNAAALVLDWDSVKWQPDSTSQYFDIDPTNPGNDILITLTGSLSRLSQNFPQDNKNITGGINPAQESLELRAAFNDVNNYITVTIDFLYSKGVSDVSFSLFDVDIDSKNNNRTIVDQIYDIKARFGDSDYIPAKITTSSNNRLDGQGLAQTVTGTRETDPTSGDANVGIQFNGTPINQITFSWRPASSIPGGNVNNQIAISDVSFTPVPEVKSALCFSIICFIFGLFRTVRFCLNKR